MKYPDDFIDQVILGDFASVQEYIPDGSIDMVFTDPPYPREYMNCFKYLADYCPRMMKRGASLITIVGHYQLETVMDFFRGRLKYRWILCLNQFARNHARMAMGIEVMWKPMLWYVKDAFPMGGGFVMDGIKIDTPEGISKTLHKWQQPQDWCEYYIKRLTKEGDVILDPYFGSGTLGIVAKKLNRHFIGIDCSPEAVEVAKQRIYGEVMPSL